MIDAVKVIFQSTLNIVATAVSVDGSWQRRGFSSLNGVVTAKLMETGKIIDFEPESIIQSMKPKIKTTNTNAFETMKLVTCM